MKKETNTNLATTYIESVRKQFRYYKKLGDKALEQIHEDAFFFMPGVESNSIAIIIQHLSGNMRSRWTDFLQSDGEKKWRNRDREFESVLQTRQEVMDAWKAGWDCFFAAMDALRADDLQSIVYIRNEGHTVLEAVNRQLAHYSYHIGQIIFVAKMVGGEDWKSLSIPRGTSGDYNAGKFKAEKQIRHFTDDV